jgi:hypothetical protein
MIKLAAMAAAGERTWHVGTYEPLAWVETAVKAVAFVVAYIAFVQALGRTLHTPDGVHIAELAFLGVAELGLLAAVGDRLGERELIAVAFVACNNAAHLGMLYALLAVPGPGGLVSLFCLLMFTGEIVKIAWLRTSHFTVRELSALVVQGLVVAYAAVYLVALLVWQFLR